MSDIASTLWTLAQAVVAANAGAQGNKEQCAMLNSQVQRVVTIVKAAKGLETNRAMHKCAASLCETLRAAAELITLHNAKRWITKLVFHAKIAASFEALFVQLDRGMTLFGVAVQARAFLSLSLSHTHTHTLSLSLSLFLSPPAFRQSVE